jgi:hypothetical protein
MVTHHPRNTRFQVPTLLAWAEFGVIPYLQGFNETFQAYISFLLSLRAFRRARPCILAGAELFSVQNAPPPERAG